MIVLIHTKCRFFLTFLDDVRVSTPRRELNLTILDTPVDAPRSEPDIQTPPVSPPAQLAAGYSQPQIGEDTNCQYKFLHYNRNV